MSYDTIMYQRMTNLQCIVQTAVDEVFHRANLFSNFENSYPSPSFFLLADSKSVCIHPDTVDTL